MKKIQFIYLFFLLLPNLQTVNASEESPINILSTAALTTYGLYNLQYWPKTETQAGTIGTFTNYKPNPQNIFSLMGQSLKFSEHDTCQLVTTVSGFAFLSTVQPELQLPLLGAVAAGFWNIANHMYDKKTKTKPSQLKPTIKIMVQNGLITLTLQTAYTAYLNYITEPSNES